MNRKNINPVSSDEPSVAIMGEEVGRRKHHDSSSVIWGVVLVYSGIVFLLNTLGILPATIWNEILQYWPVILILIGINLILGNNIFSRILLTILSIVIIGLITLMAINAVASDLLIYLPLELYDFIDYWSNLRQYEY